MLNKKIHVAVKSISLSLLVFQCLSASASETQGQIDGFYVPKKGWAETQELRPGDPIAGEQLGKIKVVLKRKGWNLLPDSEKDRIRRKLVISGTIHGLVQDPFRQQGDPVIEHKLSNRNRDGALYTLNDTISILAVEPCAPVPNAFVFSIQETLTIERGTGIYHDLQPGGNINFEGTINLCTLQNDFEIISNKGGLCFGANSDCE